LLISSLFGTFYQFNYIDRNCKIKKKLWIELTLYSTHTQFLFANLQFFGENDIRLIQYECVA